MKTVNLIVLATFLACVCVLFYSCDEEEPEPVKVADSISLEEGGSQTAIIDTELPAKIVFVVKDQFGNVFKGAILEFTVTQGMVSSSSAMSDAQGEAEVAWTLGATLGAQTLTAKAFKADGTTPLQGSPLIVTAMATPEPPFAASISLVSGNNQEAAIETTLLEPVIVIVKDQYGAAFQGAIVSFLIEDGTLSNIGATTGIDGIASVNWTLGTILGLHEMTVEAYKADGTTPLNGSPLIVQATTIQLPPVAASLAATDPGSQDGRIGKELALPIEVIVKDQYDMPFEGAVVSFSVAEGSVSHSTKITGTDGKASVTWTLGTTLGKQTMMVTAFKADGTTPLTGSPLTVVAYGAAPLTTTDIDGNVYSVVRIGTQFWMAENLKVSKYNDGTAIPLELDDIAWSNLTSPAYCWYENNEANYKDTYGALYNWYVVSTAKNGGKNVCPVDWHVPSHPEWRTLIDFLGGNSIAGGKLKEKGHSHWFDAPSSNGSNEVGFTALPGGKRDKSYRKFLYLTYHAFWWTATEYNSIWDDISLGINITYDGGSIGDHNYYWKDGLSVRCIQD